MRNTDIKWTRIYKWYDKQDGCLNEKKKIVESAKKLRTSECNKRNIK